MEKYTTKLYHKTKLTEAGLDEDIIKVQFLMLKIAKEAHIPTSQGTLLSEKLAEILKIFTGKGKDVKSKDLKALDKGIDLMKKNMK